MKRFVWLVLMMFCAVMPSRVMAAALIDDVPVQIPADLTAAQVENAIIFAMNDLKWATVSRKPGEIVAILRIRVHTATVKITYDTRAIRISYVDSTKLEYEQTDSGPQIHGNYNFWVSDLARDIQSFLQDQATISAAAKH